MRPWILPLIPVLVFSLPLEAQERMKDPEAAELAKKALAFTKPKQQRSALQRLTDHVFRKTKAPERESVLFAVGLLHARLGEKRAAAEALKKLEHSWPQSPYLEEAQVILAEDALERKRFPEAEGRLRRVLASELPVETKRQAQELLLWTLVGQEKPSEGVEILDNLFPLNAGEKPSERGLVGMFEVAAAKGLKERAEALYLEYVALYKNGAHLQRMALHYGEFLSAQGDSRGAALALRKLILDHPKAPEANEARLALATLIADGKLPDRLRKGFPTPERLLGELEGITANSDPARKALVLKLRLAVVASNWKEALALASQYRTTYRTGPESEAVAKLWGEAFRAWAQQALERGLSATLLPQLNPETMAVLLPEQRLSIIRKLAKTGLSDPLPRLVAWSPEVERPALTRAVLQELYPESHPDVVLGFLPGGKESPDQRLLRAKAELAKARWPEVKKALVGAKAGSERMVCVLALLRRPADGKENLSNRLQEAEAQRAQAPEQGADLEPLLILVADLHAKAGDWRKALALYPMSPTKAHLGWVALMRATAQMKLGQKPQARATLKAAENADAFKPERQTLAKELEV